jgi:hypothetical protein
MQIYQPYTDNLQSLFQDDVFVGLENTQDTPFWHAQNNKRVAQLSQGQPLTGHFHRNWMEMLPGTSAADIIKHVEDNPGYDVYTFSAHAFLDSNIYNEWEQGQWCHKEIITLAEAIMSKMGMDKAIIQEPMTIVELSFGQCVIGNEKFWSGYNKFLCDATDAMDNLNDYMHNLLHSDADPNQPGNPYHSFIFERLLATYLLVQRKELDVLPYLDYYERVLPEQNILRIQQKYDAVMNQDSLALDEWLDTRTLQSGNFDWARFWRK